ncbi:GAS2 domain protein [Cordyceps fumosorosea ARSEF 2679]|uniref:GAS2 domain protein n=1 Tax=Cordyceps fumosorosea (strain ARSEF 2679) TaxID=1081104 RepID=A0A162JQX7_CORFA|nr:GAS2 domain protein [Cordyceps fumosorosea ARSEF 2679]OAA72482.1 GAS2 domain protein [Cordyceps fumosorosea ARSEF 2679]
MTTFNDRPLLFKPKRQSLGHSPTRSKILADDILLYITPSTVVEALMSPTGAIRACMALASPAERDFAMRTALASQKIVEWLDEIRAWTWPEEGGSAGFEQGALQVRRTLFSSSTSSTNSQPLQEEVYMGSLPQHKVTEYARRIEEIYHGMDQLEVEDIKTHILTSHVMPLSRSTTPLSEGSRYNEAAPSYHRMDDLSAVVTAIVVQTLPNLARLTRLLQLWTMRITVLQHVNPVLTAIEDAEKFMDDAWQQVSLLAQEKARLERDGDGEPLEGVLTKDTFGPKKRSIVRKVAKPGRTLDYMLDCLEGLDDTLPDHWLERMETVERDYSEWAAVAERKIREIEWLRNILADHGEGGIRLRDESAYTDSDATIEASMLHVKDNLADRVASRDTISPKGQHNHLSLSALGVVGGVMPNMASEVVVDSETPLKQKRSASDELAQATMSPVKEEVDEEEEICLPELRSSVMADVSELADDTVLYGSHFDGMSSDGPEISASPTGFKGPVREAEYFDDSPPSSPPLSPPKLERHQMRDSVIALGDSPLVNSGLPEFEDSIGIKTPLDGSFMDDFDDSYSLADIAPPSSAIRRDSVGDQKLRSQISQIIEGIPAKIRLQSDTPNVNLNPPDLQLPHLKKKPSKDRFRRSGSAVSSRTTTPSFTLSPAKSSRPPRPQRGQQEIKVYHLSRSTGEAPIKLFIRCVGQDGERVMVRVGGGWADLSEYLKDYASHHGRRSSKPEEAVVEVRDVPQVGRATNNNNNSIVQGSSPNSRPGSRLGDASSVTIAPSTPLNVRKTRRSMGAVGSEAPRFRPKTPAAALHYSSVENTPGSEGGGGSARSRPGSRLSWVEDDSSFLGLAGPSGKKVEMSDENKAWVESVKEKVRLASGERKVPPLGNPPGPPLSSVAVNAASSVAPERFVRGSTPVEDKKRFGELGKVGGTTRLFRKSVTDGRRSGAA